MQHLFTETPKYACDVLKKEAVVQLAKQLNFSRAREEFSSCLSNLERSMWGISLTPGPISLNEGSSKTQLDLTQHAWFSGHRDLAADMLPRRCNSVRNSFLHNTTDHIIHTHPAMSRSYCLESRKEFYWERRAFLYTERKKAAIAYLGTQLGRDPVSCQYQCGWSGAENGPGQGQTQTRMETSVQAWAAELSARRALGKVSVESTAKDAKWEQGSFICWWSSGNKKISFFLCLAHHYSSFGPLAQTSFSQGSPQTGLTHCPITLQCSYVTLLIEVIWWWILVLPAARKHKVDPCLLNHCNPVPSTAAQYVAHCQPSKHLTGRKERWIKAPKGRRGLEEGQEGNIGGWCMRSFILF